MEWAQGPYSHEVSAKSVTGSASGLLDIDSLAPELRLRVPDIPDAPVRLVVGRLLVLDPWLVHGTCKGRATALPHGSNVSRPELCSASGDHLQCQSSRGNESLHGRAVRAGSPPQTGVRSPSWPDLIE
ncbi:hypothetical protein CLV68_4526 [Actinokineospora cianjurensis]|uniref:Uncharacterized protein n=1 Tax=Actinokineospora cianjurensis TaxID=585224 RepID=A0A421B206_9PSEU|nr:hypothetical protein CLV68_4526 [Actinokineospora cianjurensis]